MSMTVVFLSVLLGAVAMTAAGNVQLHVDSPNGLMAYLSPDSGSILVTRMVAAMTPPPPTTQPPPTPTTPTGSATPSASPLSSSPPPTTTNAAPTGSSSPSSMTPPPPAPTTPAGAPMTASPPIATGMINVTLGSIRELDSNMTEVAVSPPHNFYGFAGGPGFGQSPTLPPPITAKISDTNPQVSASCQTIVIPLPLNGSIFSASMCAVQSNGTATFNDERIDLAMGQLALAISIDNWPWTQNGAFLEFNFTISVPTGRRVSQTSTSGAAPLVLGLGVAGSYAVLSTKVTTDQYGLYYTMTPNFPLFSSAGDNAATVTLMFPRGQSTTQQQSIDWSAVIEPGYQPGQTPPGPVAAAAELLPMWIMQAATISLVCLLRLAQ